MNTEIYQKILNEIPHKNKYIVTEYDLLDYILILKAENERLKEQNKTLKDTLKLRTEIGSYMKKKIDKAIEYLTDENRELTEDCYYKVCELVETEDLLKILTGDDE